MELINRAICFFLLFTTAFAVSAKILTESDLPDPVYRPVVVAKPVSWPAAIADGLQVRAGSFSMRVLGVKKVVMIPGMLVLDLGSSRIRLREVTAAELEGKSEKLHGLFSKATLHLGDIPRLVFTKKAADPEPRNIYDRWIWRTAMAERSALLRGVQELYKTGNRFYYVYYARILEPYDGVVAFIVRKDMDDRYLLLQGEGVSLKVLRSIIGSFQQIYSKE